MNKKLKDIKIAVLVCDGFEEVELAKPKEALEEAGATVKIISPNPSKVKAWNHDHWTEEYNVDVSLDKVDVNDYDALLLPGGVLNPDKLRINKNAVAFVDHFLKEKKPVAAICHGPWTLIETGRIKGRKMTSYWSIKTDLINAGANWYDKEVVVDDGLITSRAPKDIPAFNKNVIEEFSKIKN